MSTVEAAEAEKLAAQSESVPVVPAAARPAAAARGRRRRASSVLVTGGRIALLVAAVWLFAVALQLIRAGAGGLGAILDFASIGGVGGHLGVGWLGSYLLLSGSPVAAVALSLYAGDVTTDLETFAMINGSRLGASLIVLVVGFVSYVAGRRSADGIYIGVVALLTAITLWTPAIPLGLLILDRGWLDGVQIASPGALTSAVALVSDPIVEALDSRLPVLALFVLGVGTLLLSFASFDHVLPNLEGPNPRLEAISRAVQKRFAMFGFGALVTLLTLSVSLSVTLLVPLALKGYIRRDRVIPYVMGANVATWIDTLFAALLLDSPRAFTVVFVEMLAGGSISLAILVFFFQPYSRAVIAAAHWASSGKLRFASFLSCLFAAPLVLILL